MLGLSMLLIGLPLSLGASTRALNERRSPAFALAAIVVAVGAVAVVFVWPVVSRLG